MLYKWSRCYYWRELQLKLEPAKGLPFPRPCFQNRFLDIVFLTNFFFSFVNLNEKCIFFLPKLFFICRFKSERPDDEEKVPGGFLSDIDPNSLTVSKILVGETSIKNYKHYDRFQFERIGYFSVDIDTNDEKLVFNSIVSLKQDPGFVSNV